MHFLINPLIDCIGADVSLSVPRRYTALAGDLLVAFSTSDEDAPLNDTDSWYIDVIASRDSGGHLRPLTTVDIPGGYSDGELSIGCGVVDVAGQLVVRLVDSTTSDVVAQSSVVDVSWPPSVKLRLPDSHRALTKDLRVTLGVGGDIACQSQHSVASYTLQLFYLGLNRTSFVDASRQTSRVVFSQTLATPLSSKSSTDLIVSCSLIDRAGVYQAALISSRSPDLPVAVSNAVVVAWSHAYSLSLSSSLSASPCRRNVVVYHTQPRCDAGSYTVRVLARRRQLPGNDNDNYVVVGSGEDVTRSRDWRHVTERRVTSSSTSSTFDCADVLPRHDGGQRLEHCVLHSDDDDDVSLRHLEHCVVLLSTANDNSEHVHQRVCTTHSHHRGQSVSETFNQT